MTAAAVSEVYDPRNTFCPSTVLHACERRESAEAAAEGTSDTAKMIDTVGEPRNGGLKVGAAPGAMESMQREKRDDSHLCLPTPGRAFAARQLRDAFILARSIFA